jgi:molybdopterin/thiamine biosynthesis adenylyltransferase
MLDTPRITGEDVHSRSIAAGYRPDELHRAKVLVAGLGALGQNLVQTLSLSGVGNLLLVDFDVFEPHNVTRSPLYGVGVRSYKAPIVARRCLELSTAPAPVVRYSPTLVQELGDLAVAWSDVVVSAVDSVSTRAWLAERARVYGKPIAEGGFSGPLFNFSLFSGDDGRACYRCHNPFRESSASCTRYALEAEAARVVPAIQSVAATTAGFMAEQVIQALHGNLPEADERHYGDLRKRELHRSSLKVNPRCAGVHHRVERRAFLDLDHVPEKAAEFGSVLADRLGAGLLVLSEPLLLKFPCVRCGRLCAVGAGESTWLVDSRCQGCGGRWDLAEGRSPIAVKSVRVPEDLAPGSPLATLPAAELGVRPAGAFVYESERTGPCIVTISGEMSFPVQPASPDE